MREDDGGVLQQCAPDDFARVDGSAIDGAPEQLFEGEHSVPVVEQAAAEVFIIELADPRAQKLAGLPGSGERFAK